MITGLGGGGTARSLLGLATGLLERGHKVDIILLQTIIRYPIPEGARIFTVGDGADKVTKERFGQVLARSVRLPRTFRLADWVRLARAVNWDLLCFPGPYRASEARAIATYLELEKPDCVLPSLPAAKVVSLLASRLLSDAPPVIPLLRNFVGRRPYRWRRRYRRLFTIAAHFVGVSEGVSKSLAATIRVPSDKITTIYNPVFTADIALKMAAIPNHRWLLDGDVPVILAAGRLSHQKDYPTLIRSFARVAKRRSCRLVILGEGRKRRPLERLVARLGLADRVSLPGWVENPFSFMSRADVFVLSSIYEGLPGVLVQALACRCPCVSTDCPAGPAEILDNGKYGELVPVRDDVALAEAMERVLDRPPDGKLLEQRAAWFSSQRSVVAYEKLILDVAKQPS